MVVVASFQKMLSGGAITCYHAMKRLPHCSPPANTKFHHAALCKLRRNRRKQLGSVGGGVGGSAAF